MVTTWPVELFCQQAPSSSSGAWMGVLPGAQVLEFAQAEEGPAAYLSYSCYSEKSIWLVSLCELHLVPSAALH